MLRLCRTPLLLLLALAWPLAAWGDHPDHGHGTDKAKCHKKDGSVLDAAHSDGEDHSDHDHSGHDHHRRLDHPGTSGNTYLVRTGSCVKWTSLIRNYTATDGNKGGTYVRVFSDGSTTAQIDAVIKRNGEKMKNASVMAHLHVGRCTQTPIDDFDSSGVRESTSGPHWKNSDNKEMHFEFTTDKDGNSDAMSCTPYEVDRSAVSVVLHESDDGAVIKMGAKKLCCDLVWTDDNDKASFGVSLGISGYAASLIVGVATWMVSMRI